MALTGVARSRRHHQSHLPPLHRAPMARSYQQIGSNRHIFIHKLLRVSHLGPHLQSFEERVKVVLPFAPVSRYLSISGRRKSSWTNNAIKFKKKKKARSKGRNSVSYSKVCIDFFPICVTGHVESNTVQGKILPQRPCI